MFDFYFFHFRQIHIKDKRECYVTFHHMKSRDMPICWDTEHVASLHICQQKTVSTYVHTVCKVISVFTYTSYSEEQSSVTCLLVHLSFLREKAFVKIRVMESSIKGIWVKECMPGLLLTLVTSPCPLEVSMGACESWGWEEKHECMSTCMWCIERIDRAS